MPPPTILPLLNVLVIEDDADMRALLCRTLTRHKVGGVVEAATAEEALLALRAPDNEINFVLADWGLPGLSGLDLCRMLKAEKPILPILMVTGRDDAASVREAQSAGIDGYLIKPIAPRELVPKIEHVVRQVRARRVR